MLVINIHALIPADVPLLWNQGEGRQPSKPGSLQYLGKLRVPELLGGLGRRNGRKQRMPWIEKLPLLYLKDAACMAWDPEVNYNFS